MPGEFLTGGVALIGLALGLRYALDPKPPPPDRAMRSLGWLLAASSAMLTIIAAAPPAAETPRPCLQIHHCVTNPHRATTTTSPRLAAPTSTRFGYP
jgi:hypothetical protein